MTEPASTQPGRACPGMQTGDHGPYLVQHGEARSEDEDTDRR